MFKPSSNGFTNRSKEVLLLWILFYGLRFTFGFFMLPCLFLAGFFSPVGKGLTSWFSCVSLSHMVSRVRCGTWLYRFLIFTVSSSFLFTLKKVTLNKKYLFSLQRKREFNRLFNILLSNSQNMCHGYSKNPSRWERAFWAPTTYVNWKIGR